jgi:tricorn protease interacting factor F2/3
VVGYLEERNFKEGLRRYLEKHQYGCAASAHLWEAMEEISEEPIVAMMKSWIEQSGFPLVEAQRDGNTIILSQRRFTYLPNGYDQVWVIPVSVQVFYESGRSQTIATLFEGKTTGIDVGRGATAYKVNQGQTGFYRVRYLKEDDLAQLGNRVSTRELCAEDRWGLENDLYALVKSGEAALDQYLKLLSHYKNDDGFLPLTSIADHLFDAYLVVDGTQRAEIASVNKSFLEAVLTRIGYKPDPREKHIVSILRDQVMVYAAIFGSDDAAEFGERMFRLMREGKNIHPDITKSVLQIAALNGDEHTFSWLAQRFECAQSEYERMNLLAALGSFQNDALIRKAQAYILTVVPDRNKFIPITYMASNPHAITSLWEWYESHVSIFEQFHPMHFERIVAAIVPVCGIERRDQVTEFFEHYMKQKDKARDVIRLSLERLAINSRMRAATSYGRGPR